MTFVERCHNTGLNFELTQKIETVDCIEIRYVALATKQNFFAQRNCLNNIRKHYDCGSQYKFCKSIAQYFINK